MGKFATDHPHSVQERESVRIFLRQQGRVGQDQCRRSTTVSRSDGIYILWTGGDPNANVNIQGAVSIVDAVTFKISAGGSFTCIVPNTG